MHKFISSIILVIEAKISPPKTFNEVDSDQQPDNDLQGIRTRKNTDQLF